MQFYEVIQNRKSIKSYKDTNISEAKLSKIVNAAMMAPSWKNHTSYKFILVDDVNKKNQLAATILNNDTVAANAVREAPMAVVVVADPSVSGTVGDREYYLVDSAIALEHFVLAATNEGYGTCWIGALKEEDVKNILQVPASFKVVAMTPIGEVRESTEHNPRKDVGEYVFVNTWNSAYHDNINPITQIH